MMAEIYICLGLIIGILLAIYFELAQIREKLK